MAKPSSPIYSPGEASTKLERLTAFPCGAIAGVAPPVVPLCSLLELLMKGVGEIAGATRRSKSQELADFGKYVNNMVNQLVSVLPNSPVAQQSHVRLTLDELYRTLCSISNQITSIINSSGLLCGRYLRRLITSEEDPILRMRRQLEDALQVFWFAASLELLLKVPAPFNNKPISDALKPIQSRILESFHSSNTPVRDHTLQADRSSQAVESLQDSPTIRLNDPRLRLRIQRDNLPHTPAVEKLTPAPEAGEIIAAFMNVESKRRLYQSNRASVRMAELAAAIGYLSNLLERAGRTREAYEASQESAELYRTLAEKEH
ncbi:unnamed protein product [Rhizoctonia solani]|uniref:Uncharacterized protein n=1 Tax=Rhizoctonia solani TaxID=456999 RepID=A0A8H3E3S9_9AGAM|nr:unnamed protein product [Rhizoctonia solani]